MLIKQRGQAQQKQSSQGEEEKKGETGQTKASHQKTFYALIKFERDTLSQEQTLLIGSKLDVETAQKQCRLCFYGQVLALFPSNQSPEERTTTLQQLKIIKLKSKMGKIDKLVNENEIHIRDLFNKDTA